MAKASPAQKTIYDLTKQKAAALALRETLKVITGGEEDADLIRDTIEGETSLYDTIAQVDAFILDDETLVVGIKAAIASLNTRKDRIEKRIDSYKTAIEQALVIGEVREKMELPTGTISLRKVPSKLEVTDEEKIATSFFTTPEPVLDRKALLDVLKAHRDAVITAEAEGTEPPPCPVEGATLSAEGITLSVRRA